MTSGGASGARRRQQRRRKAEEKRPLEVGEDLDVLKTHLSFGCLLEIVPMFNCVSRTLC